MSDTSNNKFKGHDEGTIKPTANVPEGYHSPAAHAPLPEVPLPKEGYGTHGETGGTKK